MTGTVIFVIIIVVISVPQQFYCLFLLNFSDILLYINVVFYKEKFVVEEVQNVYTREVVSIPASPKNHMWKIIKDRYGYILQLLQKKKIGFFTINVVVDENPVRGSQEKEFQKIAKLILEEDNSGFVNYKI